MLAERDGISVVAARADMQGYLTDLAELLEPLQSLREHDPEVDRDDE